MNHCPYIPVTRRACYYSFKGTDTQLDQIFEILNIYIPEDYTRSDKVFRLRQVLHEGLVANIQHDHAVRFCSLVHNLLVTWSVYLSFMNDKVREYHIKVLSIDKPKPDTSHHEELDE